MFPKVKKYCSLCEDNIEIPFNDVEIEYIYKASGEAGWWNKYSGSENDAGSTR